MRSVKHFINLQKEPDRLPIGTTDTHRINSIERAISTQKNYFVSGLIGTDNILPMHMWYRLIDQAQTVMNMLRLSKHNSNISVHATMEGNFYF